MNSLYYSVVYEIKSSNELAPFFIFNKTEIAGVSIKSDFHFVLRYK